MTSDFTCAEFGSAVDTHAGVAGSGRMLAVGSSLGTVDVWVWPGSGAAAGAGAGASVAPHHVGEFAATLPAEEGGPLDVVTQLAWRGDVLVAGGDSGRLWAWDTSAFAQAASQAARPSVGSDGRQAPLPARLCLGTMVDGAVMTMAWDAVAARGVVLSDSGSIWCVMWVCVCVCVCVCGTIYVAVPCGWKHVGVGGSRWG